MHNLEYYFRIFQDKDTSEQQKQLLVPEFSQLLFELAMHNIQQRASTHGVIDNASTKLESGIIVGGLMQDLHNVQNLDGHHDNAQIINCEINFSSNRKLCGCIGKYEIDLDYNQPSLNRQFAENEFQGFIMVSFANCESFTLLNPYSNPLYFGGDLINNLWPVSSTTIKYIPIPLVSNTFFIDIVKKCYQAELFAVAANHTFDFADQCTPKYFRPIRSVQLFLGAFNIYETLAREISQRFSEDSQQRINSRILYQTIVKHMLPASEALCAWVDCLQVNGPYSDEVLLSYNEILSIYIDKLERCNSIIRSYVFDLQNNENWQFEQSFLFLRYKVAQQEMQKYSSGALLVIDQIVSTAYAIRSNIEQAQIQFNALCQSQKSILQCSKLSLFGCAQTNIFHLNYSISIALEEFAQSLGIAIRDSYIRGQILNSLNTTMQVHGAKNSYVQILSDNQLHNIYTYVLKVIRNLDFRMQLLQLPLDIFQSEHLAACEILKRKRSNGDLRDPLLVRNVSISRATDGFKLSLLPNRKDFKGDPILPKYKGHVSTVTAQYDITPLANQVQQKCKATKSIDLGLGDKLQVVHENYIELQQDVKIMRAMGRSVSMGPCYPHFKHYKSDRGELVKQLRIAVRVTEEWSFANLFVFIQQLIVDDDSVLLLDREYSLVKNLGNISDIAKVKSKIIHRLIGGILQDVQVLHGKLRIVHNDIKPDNILIFVDDNQQLIAKLSDFDLSEYMSDIEKHASQPVATSSYASPQVVGFTVMTNKILTYSDLFHQLKRKDNYMRYYYPSYGRELLYSKYSNHKTVLNRDEYANLKADQKDDMFSLGISLFMLITLGYPTNYGKHRGNVFNYFASMQVEEAYKKFPQYHKLLRGLLEFERAARFDIESALLEYYAISPANTQTTMRPTATV